MNEIIIGDSLITNKVEATSLVTKSYQLDSHINLLPVIGLSTLVRSITGLSLIDLEEQ